ncbi:uncharacterized protein ACA1_140230 [Acanthamoeba castellanii str. Neff]|uniref:Cyclic phosphodiesterase n=1 Tax=Acanthamoeba castellanii (strain ATCC 30010 / Neff) TaxID=1257118 RepID=L8GH45_ACACF|nr:uncharacterized protein ACA1_140230 [Acanthamoeba castellanii str. Neff]ELR12139.1 hypothetical protein ACA1_140230 [Acanthamoeba castellanii str. Neff]
MADSDAKYSLWLMPDRNSHQWDLLTQTIEALRKDEQQHGKPPPVFVPHLTLLGSVSGVGLAELKERVETLAHSCGGVPLRVWLHDLGKGSTFHQCVFIHARKTPELLKAYTHAQQVFGRAQPGSQATFMPHVSLLYADIPDSTKDRIIAHLQAEGRLSEKAASFNANSIHIWRTDGDEASWHEVASIPLVG